MFLSKKKKFQIAFLDFKGDSEYYINDIITKERENYLCVEKGQNFRIRMIAAYDPTVVFGSKLYIDGKEIYGEKSFLGIGHYFGHKLGDGNYNTFMFDNPLTNLKEKSEYSKEEVFYGIKSPDYGKIKLEFFKTKQITVKKQEKKFNSNHERFSSSIRPDDKKFFLMSLTIKEGEGIKIENTYKKNHIDKFEGDKMTVDVTDYTTIYDSLEVKYADFLALQIMGHVS